MRLSKVNEKITVEYLQQPENLYFLKKSAKTDLKIIANEVMALANAQGGVVAFGVSDNGLIEGFNKFGINKLTDAQKIITSYLKPAPKCHCEFININNYKGESDIIILYHVEPSSIIIRNIKNEVFCRKENSSIKLTSEEIKYLENDKNVTN